MGGFSNDGSAGQLSGTRHRARRTARVSSCLTSRLEPAQTTQCTKTALPEQPKITLIAAYAEHLERANFSTTSAALAPLSMGLVMPRASSRARVR